MERAENGPSPIQKNILLCGTSEAQIKAAGRSQGHTFANYLSITLRCHGHREDLIERFVCHLLKSILASSRAVASKPRLTYSNAVLQKHFLGWSPRGVASKPCLTYSNAVLRKHFLGWSPRGGLR